MYLYIGLYALYRGEPSGYEDPPPAPVSRGEEPELGDSVAAIVDRNGFLDQACRRDRAAAAADHDFGG